MQYLSLVLVVGFLAWGCQSSEISYIPAETEAYGYDFREYSAEGFLFTPYDYEGDYQSVGMVTFIAWPEAEKVEASRKVQQRTGKTEVWRVGEVTPSEAINEAYQKASQMGADALIHFEVNSTSKTVAGAELSGIEVSGFAIDRQDAGAK